ncbi:MAG: ATP-binding protein [Holosporales bacterium]
MAHPVDLAEKIKRCKDEAVHIIGVIQSFACVVVLDIPSLKIVQVSENSKKITGYSPQKLIGKKIHFLLGKHYEEILEKWMLYTINASVPCYLFSISFELIGITKAYDVAVHIINNKLVLEFEPASCDPQLDQQYLDDLDHLKSLFGSVDSQAELSKLLENVIQSLKRCTPFNRIMVYQFQLDHHGKVIAEVKDQDLESYLHLHYPASDIPSQVRQLFLKGWVRYVADINDAPIAMFPATIAQSQVLLDMTYLVSRGVSQVHIQYMRNMGVRSSLAATLKNGDQLWGLIAAHSADNTYVTRGMRALFEFSAQALSDHIARHVAREVEERSLFIKKIESNYLSRFAQQGSIMLQLIEGCSPLYAYLDATGAAVVFDGQVQTIGVTPTKVQILELLQLIQSSADEESKIFSCNCLAEKWPQTKAYSAIAAGVLGIKLSPGGLDYILWFRPEQLQTIDWAGNPTEVYENVQGDISPRHSFKKWREIVRHRCVPWTEFESQAALRFCEALEKLSLRRLVRAEVMSENLRKINEDLQAFAYVASHDLREPLRGISIYATLLQQTASTKLDEEEKDRLHTIMKMAQRMDNLINSLMAFSDVNLRTMNLHEVNLNQVLQDVLEDLSAMIKRNRVEIKIPRELPYVLCDPLRIAEVLSNLISNAIKYNDKKTKIVEMGYDFRVIPGLQDEEKKMVFYVKDNGIGIDPDYFDKIFQIFKRIYSPALSSEGSGAGLTIVKRIIDRHQGHIWLESKPGVGSTFFFTLNVNK